jgi:5-(carboxyamino)imidazole ribonucleotide mutase
MERKAGKVEQQRTPQVGVIMGSDSDLPIVEEALQVLDEFEVPYEVKILSAHRSPGHTSAYARSAAERGLRVLVAAAGWAAHLAGVLAAETVLPVIGIPVNSSPLQGLDALLSTVQMPPGIPVATMAIGKGGAHNAALFAIQILALQEPLLSERLQRFKHKMAEDIVTRKTKRVEEYLLSRPSENPE